MRLAKLAAPFAFLAVAGWTVTARADLPPPDDYVETCTIVQAEARTGQRCKTCSGSMREEYDQCPATFEGTSYVKECKEWGATAYSEVWCDPKDEPSAQEHAKARAQTPSKRGCSVVGGSGGGGSGGGAGLWMVLLAVPWRRRRWYR